MNRLSDILGLSYCNRPNEKVINMQSILCNKVLVTLGIHKNTIQLSYSIVFILNIRSITVADPENFGGEGF